MMKEKKPHGVQLLIRAIVRDPDGKVISDTGEKPSRSFVIQFLEFLYFMFTASGSTSHNATATDGSEDRILWGADRNYFHLKLDAGVNDDTHGLVVGTGDTAEANTDHKLETQLTEGVGAGNITHGAVEIDAVAVVGANVDLLVKRAFTNATGSTITVKEAGAYAEHSAAYRHCIIRDVLGASIEVPDKCSLTVIYTVRTTV